MSFQIAKVHKKLETRKINFVDSGKISIFAIGNPSYIPMLQDIFDKDGKVIAQVETVRMETKYGDGRGHHVVEVWDDLRFSDFKGLDLQNANFREMNLSQANFMGANLKGADFRNASLRYTKFYNANLEGADFRGADMLCSHLNYSQKKGIIYDRTTKFPPPEEHHPAYM